MSGLPSSAAGYPDVEDGSLHSAPLLCHVVGPGPGLDAAVAWLSGSGGGDAAARAACEAGGLFALVDVAAAAGDPPVAAAVVVPRGEGAVELSLLHAPGPRAPELTRRLLAEVCDALRHGEAARLVVAAGNCRVPPPEVLEAGGFRVLAVGPDTGWLELRL